MGKKPGTKGVERKFFIGDHFVIVGGRQTGKTELLIDSMSSDPTNECVLVVANEEKKRHAMAYIQQWKYNIPAENIFTLHEVDIGKLCGRQNIRVMVDDADVIITHYFGRQAVIVDTMVVGTEGKIALFRKNRSLMKRLKGL